MNKEPVQEDNNVTQATEQPKKPGFWRRYGWLVMMTLGIGVCVFLTTPTAKDWMNGMFYRPSNAVIHIRDDLHLTAKGERVFNAVQPTLERNADFNEVCNSHNVDISLLGCYTGGKIYVYEVQDERLVAANKVTMAHELLHAIWERLSDGERERVKTWLNAVYEDKKEWFDGELETYSEENRMDEIYARAGTKLGDLPQELEEHYAQYFQDRTKIVTYYQEYEAPFNEMKQKMEELMKQIEATKAEIEREREEYMAGVRGLEAEITKFNNCANTAGCFASQAAFTSRRSSLLAQRAELEEKRTALNTKITENNARIEEYRKIQEALGELNDAMNSNVELIEETQDV